MSDTDWDIVAEEPSSEPEEHRIHSATAIGAAAHARDAADVAEKAAAQAEKLAKQSRELLDHIRDVLERAVSELHDKLYEIVQSNTRVQSELADGLHALADAMRDTHGEHAKAFDNLTKALTSGRRLTRDGSGRVTGMEPVQ